jgi:hypothetical protein
LEQESEAEEELSRYSLGQLLTISPALAFGSWKLGAILNQQLYSEKIPGQIGKGNEMLLTSQLFVGEYISTFHFPFVLKGISR